MKTVVTVPCRINIIGEHIDYHGGIVLPFASAPSFHFTCQQRNDNAQYVHSEHFDTTIDLSNQEDIAKAGWSKFFTQVLKQLPPLPVGFELNIAGQIPVGAGLSSSSAITCGFIWCLNRLYHLGFDAQEIIQLAYKSEHGVGVQGGLMDQTTIVMGRARQALILDCRDESIEYVSLGELFEKAVFVLVNTGHPHQLTDGQYNTRREASEKAFQTLQKYEPDCVDFRSLNESVLQSHQDRLSSDEWNLLNHFVTENQRSLDMVTAIKAVDLNVIGSLLLASHQSLRDKYGVSWAQADFVVDFTSQLASCYGGRMMGGGFGGATIHLVSKDRLQHFTRFTSLAYEQQFGLRPEFIMTTPIDGIGA